MFYCDCLRNDFFKLILSGFLILSITINSAFVNMHITIASLKHGIFLIELGLLSLVLTIAAGTVLFTVGDFEFAVSRELPGLFIG
jgi:hypothetical protein